MSNETKYPEKVMFQFAEWAARDSGDYWRYSHQIEGWESIGGERKTTAELFEIFKATKRLE